VLVEVELVLGVVHQQVLEVPLDISKDLVRASHGVDRSDTVAPLLDDRHGLRFEGVQPLLDGLGVVIDTAAGLGSSHQSLGHLVVGSLEVHDCDTSGKLILELASLGDVPGEAIDEVSLGPVVLFHAVTDQLQNGVLGDQFALGHGLLQLLSAWAVARDLISQQVAGGHVAEPVLCYDFLALCSFAGSRSAQDEDDGLLIGCV